MSPVKDLTQAQYDAKLTSYGMRATKQFALGYVEVVPGTMVCAFNGGKSRSAQLAYLLRERDRLIAAQALAARKAEFHHEMHGRLLAMIPNAGPAEAAALRYATQLMALSQPWQRKVDQQPAAMQVFK